MVVMIMLAEWMRAGRLVSSDQLWMVRVWGIEKGGIGQWIASMATMWWGLMSAVVFAMVASNVVVSVEEEKMKKEEDGVYILVGRCGPELTVDKLAWSWLTAGRR